MLDKSAIAFEHNDKVILRTSVQGSEVLVFEGLEVAGSFGQSGLPVNCAPAVRGKNALVQDR